MRKAFGFILLLSAAACGGGGESGGERRTSEDLRTFDVQEGASANATADMAAPPAPAEARGPRPPGVAPTAAPGVAFNYGYAFELPAERIAPIQEQHASACEKLGVENCRITGMRYELTGEDEVRAQLAFKLNPALARKFGREAIDMVDKADGRLTLAQITGEDVGSRIEQGGREQVGLGEELRRIEQQLARGGLSSAERVELQAQAQSLRERLRMGQSEQTARRAQLATTPMVFNYDAGEADRSFGAALSEAFEGALDFARGFLILLIYLLPFALAALLVWLVGRWVQRRFFARRDEKVPEEGPATTAA
jgi:hypothetical protein